MKNPPPPPPPPRESERESGGEDGGGKGKGSGMQTVGVQYGKVHWPAVLSLSLRAGPPSHHLPPAPLPLLEASSVTSQRLSDQKLGRQLSWAYALTTTTYNPAPERLLGIKYVTILLGTSVFDLRVSSRSKPLFRFVQPY